jgi:hypothetical protein
MFISGAVYLENSHKGGVLRMLSKFFVATPVLLAIAGSLAFGQNPPTNYGKPIPDYVLYDSFLFRVTWADRQASKMASQGIDDTFYRTLIRRQVGLTTNEEAMLKAIAADWRRADSQIQKAIQAARASGVPATSQGVQNLRSQRIQTVRDHIGQLQAGFGNMRFEVLDAFVRRSATVKPPGLPSPPKSAARN